MRFGLALVLALVGALAFAGTTLPPGRPPCESGMWQEQWNGDGHDGEQVCMTMDRPHHDPIPSFRYSLDV